MPSPSRSFRPTSASIITPVIGLIATLAPTIGPTVGGYLTELFSWHWLFLINVIPGIAVAIGAWLLIDFDKPDFKLAKTFDWAALALLAVFLGTLEYVLEEGPGENWFESRLIFFLTLTCIISGWRCSSGGFSPRTIRWWISPLSRTATFVSGSIFSFIMGIGLYGLTYLYPVYLARVHDYSALQIGETLFVTGVAMFLTAPIVGRLSAKLDPRIMIGLGFVGFGIGTWKASCITVDWSYSELLIPQILRGVSPDAVHGDDHQCSLGTLAPMQLQGRFRPVQPHPQSGRRCRPCPYQHGDERPHGSSPGAVA